VHCYDNRTINIVMAITITVTITTKLQSVMATFERVQTWIQFWQLGLAVNIVHRIQKVTRH